MRSIWKRVLSVLMVLTMLTGMLPMSAFADSFNSNDLTIGGPTEEEPVTVTVEPASVAMLSTDEGSLLTAAVTGAEEADVTWSIVSGGDVVALAGDGLTATVKPASEAASGEAVIRVSCQPDGQTEAVYADCAVTVTPAQKSLEVTPGQISMFVTSLGADLTATVLPADITVEAEWTSSNPDVATVDAGGHVTPVAVGTAEITASAQGMTSTCAVTVKEVKYRVVYNSNYPADAKKFAYQNGNKDSGKDSSPLVDAVDTNAVYEVLSGQTHTIISGMTCANYNFAGWSLVSGSAELNSSCTPGTEISVDDNLVFYATWQKNTATTTRIVYIDYCYVDANGKSVKNTRSTTACLVGQDESGNDLYSFQLGNCADGLKTAAQNDRTVRGWIVNGTNYDFNTICTTTLGANGHVRADAWQDTSLLEEEAFAQFFVHKYRVSPGGSAGTATVDYYSVGTGKVKVVLEKIKDRVGGNVSDDVSAYILEAPSAAQIASAMQISLSESENIRWFKIVRADDGYHVDGVIYGINKNWTVRFIDPMAGNRVVRSVAVEDKGSLTSFPAGPSHAGEVFECWVDESGKPISAIDVVVQDRTVYAKYKDKVMLTGVIDYGTVTNASQTVVTDQKTQAMVFTAAENRVITSVHVNDKAQSIKANQTTYTFTGRKLTANTYVVVTTKGADAQIRFDPNGGTGEPNPVKGEFGAAVTDPFPSKQPVRPGYTFDGWYTEPNGGSKVTGYPDSFDQLETVYYAHWKENVITVTITGNHVSVPYDGQAHKAVGYTFHCDDSNYTESDFTFTGTAEAVTTDADKVFMNLDAAQFTNNSPNYAKVNFVIVDGYAEVTPLDVTVTVTGNSDTKAYDGQLHSVTGYKFESSSALYTQDCVTFSGSDTAERTNVGTTPMGMKPEDFANTNPNFNVSFNVIDGGMTITPAAAVVVTITGNNDTVTYDGKEHKATGYTVSTDNPQYTAADFSFSGKAEAKRTDAGTAKMGLDASQFANTNPNYGKVTFVIVDGFVKVEPLKVNVTVEGNSDTFTYDGQEHTVTGYTVTSDSKAYSQKNIAFTGEAVAARTEVGQTAMGLEASQFTNTNENFNVSFTVKDGGVKISPMDAVVVTIVGNHDSKAYNGSEQNVTGYTVTAVSNPLYTASDFSFTGSAEAKRTDVGHSPMGLAESQFTNNNPNFSNVTFSVVDGYIDITPLDVTVKITGSTGTFTYDGSEHTVTGYKVDTGSDLLTEKDITFSGTAEAKRTDAGTTYMGMTPNDFANTNKNFNVSFEVIDGNITVEPVESITVKITGHTKTVTYDGEEHTVTGYDVEIKTPGYTESNIGFTGTAEAKGTDADSYGMGLKAEDFVNQNPNVKNVVFEVTDGGLLVKPLDVEVTVTGHTDSKVFDGEEHKVEGYSFTSDSPLYTEDMLSFTGTASAKRTDVGQTFMGLKNEQFANTNDNFNVKVTVKDGSMTITPVKAVTVTITGHKVTATYDGTEHTAFGYDVTVSDLLYTAADFSFTGTAEVKRTNVGETAMGLKVNQFVNNNANFETVNFVVNDGLVKVNPLDVKITVTGHTDTVPYDGTEHTVTGYEISADSNLFKPEDVTFTGKDEAKRTDAGTTAMGLEENQFQDNNENLHFTFEIIDGGITVEPITDEVVVTLKGKTAGGVYNGQDYVAEGYTVESISNPLYKESFFSMAGGKTAKAVRKDVGKTEMGLTADSFVNNSQSFTNVRFEVVDGYVEVTPAKVIVTVDDKTVTYGEEEPELTATVTGTIGGDTVNYTITREPGSDAGDHKVTVTGSSKQGNYVVEYVDGKITVRPRTLIITAGNMEWEYDGNTHTGSEKPENFTVGTGVAGQGLVNGDSVASVTFTGSIKLPGTTENAVSNAVFSSGSASNYDIRYVPGTLKVTDRSVKHTVTVVADSAVFLYDGTNHTVNTYSVNVAAVNSFTAALTGNLPKSAGSNAFSIGGHTYTVSGLSAYGDRADAGKSVVALSGEPVILDEDGNDVTAQFSVNRISGQITVTPRKVTLQSDNAAKVYDGTALTNHNVIIGGADGFAPGEGVTFNVTGSQTTVGTSENAFTYAFNGNTKSANYDVTVLFGNLSVYAIPVYRLTVHYVYEDGTQAAADYHGAFAAGEAYTVISPAIDGYRADALYIRSGANGMPAANVEYTVTYRKNGPENVVPEKGVEIHPDPTDPADYDLIVIDEDEVPLAQGGGHVDDIVHFLLIVAAAVVEFIYFRKRKNYQEEIFELKKKLGDTSMDEE